MMQTRILTAALALALPLAAFGQATITPEAPPPQTPPAAPATPEAKPADDPLDLIERGTGMIFDDLLRKVQPHLEGLARGVEDTVARFGPALNELGVLIDDIGNYEAPERLPNGDVILRRKADAPPPPPIGNALRDLTTPRPPENQPEPPPAPAPDAVQAPPIDL